MISFLAKLDFMSKSLDSCRKQWHQFGRNKDCHKILHDISNKWTVNKTNQGTGQDIYYLATVIYTLSSWHYVVSLYHAPSCKAGIQMFL